MNLDRDEGTSWPRLLQLICCQSYPSLVPCLKGGISMGYEIWVPNNLHSNGACLHCRKYCPTFYFSHWWKSTETTVQLRQTKCFNFILYFLTKDFSFTRLKINTHHWPVKSNTASKQNGLLIDYEKWSCGLYPKIQLTENANCLGIFNGF